MPWYALCQGRDLPICNSCRRLVSYQAKPPGKHEVPLSPVTNGLNCVHWMARPPQPPRLHAITPSGEGAAHG